MRLYFGRVLMVDGGHHEIVVIPSKFWYSTCVRDLLDNNSKFIEWICEMDNNDNGERLIVFANIECKRLFSRFCKAGNGSLSRWIDEIKIKLSYSGWVFWNIDISRKFPRYLILSSFSVGSDTMALSFLE